MSKFVVDILHGNLSKGKFTNDCLLYCMVSHTDFFYRFNNVFFGILGIGIFFASAFLLTYFSTICFQKIVVKIL
jgi:hypothetical protein